MPREFHLDKDVYFDQQYRNALASIVPFVERHAPIGPQTRVLEIGCDAGGVLKAFAERGARVTGVDLNEESIDYARERFRQELGADRARFETSDIYDVDAVADLQAPFELVLLKDTIEHIHDQRRLLSRFDSFLAPSGHAFLAFPPWQMPFGGHQQTCAHPLLMRTPYFHLLPRRAYAGLLRKFREPPETVDALLEIKETGISIERFERIVAETHHRIVDRALFLINPIYQYRYGLAPRAQIRAIARAPYLRDFLTTSAYYLISAPEPRP